MASETASAVASTDLGVVVLSSALRLTVRLKVAAILCMMSICGTSTTGWGIKPLEVVCCGDGLRIRSPHHGNSMLCNFTKIMSISFCVVWQQHWKWRRIKWLKVVGSTRLLSVHSWCCGVSFDFRQLSTTAVIVAKIWSIHATGGYMGFSNVGR